MSHQTLRQAWFIIHPPHTPKFEFTLWGGIPWTIGRHQSCRIILQDQFVSRLHAIVNSVIFQNQYLFFVTDNGSSNGTLHNGNSLTHSALLHDQDALVMGRTILKFHYPKMFKVEKISEIEKIAQISSSLPWVD